MLEMNSIVHRDVTFLPSLRFPEDFLLKYRCFSLVNFRCNVANPNRFRKKLYCPRRHGGTAALPNDGMDGVWESLNLTTKFIRLRATLR